jgi:nitrogen fixation protein FixH
MTAQRTWLVAIAGLLGVNVVAMIVLAVVANHGTSQVIPDYYARAAHYDDELARSTVSQALGWRVDVAIDRGAIAATVRDAAGQAIDGAQVRITGYQRAHASDAVDVALSVAATGHYRGTVPARRGWYDLVAVVDARGARYTQHVVVEAR